MNYQHSHYLLRTIMPTVKNKGTFALIAAVADATWGWGVNEVKLSINELVEATGLSASGVRKALKDDDFYAHCSRVRVDETNILEGYTYSMIHSVDGTQSNTEMVHRVNQVPHTEEHSDTTQSDIATSGHKEYKEILENENKNPPTPHEQLIVLFESLTARTASMTGAHNYKLKWHDPADAILNYCAFDLELAKRAMTEAVRIHKTSENNYRLDSVYSIRTTVMNWIDDNRKSATAPPTTVNGAPVIAGSEVW